MAKKRVKIPSIRGHIADKLAKARPREIDEMVFEESLPDLIATDAQERGVLALALLLLEQVREDGGTRAPQRPLEALLKRLLSSLEPKQVMDLEIETYEILLWIASAIDPEIKPHSEEDPNEIDPTQGNSFLIRWAIAKGEDLNMSYYTHGRGEITERRITPLSIEAETYLHAYCHLRHEERVFRLTRIANLEPAIGWNRVKSLIKKSKVEEPKPDSNSEPAQPSLFD